MTQEFAIEENLLCSQRVIDACPKDCSQYVIITDDNVQPLYADTLKKHLEKNHLSTELITIPNGELSKSREMAAEIQDRLFDLGCGRDTCILALGGGVITDLAGFVAATYCRGIPVIYLPTTLLAMVDAALGGKTGVNTPHGKNLIGVFAQPTAILSDISTLKTLPKIEFLCAFAEIIKHAVIFDEDYFKAIANNVDSLKQGDVPSLKSIIQKSFQIKSNIVSQDEKDQGIRAICNFGHTIGHALELVCDYSINHGQAIAIGMIVESYIAEQMGILSHAEFMQIKELISRFEIPLSIPTKLTKTSIINALILDKKSRKKNPRFVLIQNIGTPYKQKSNYTHLVEDIILDDALNYLITEFKE